jgi:hypothetical protein
MVDCQMTTGNYHNDRDAVCSSTLIMRMRMRMAAGECNAKIEYYHSNILVVPSQHTSRLEAFALDDESVLHSTTTYEPPHPTTTHGNCKQASNVGFLLATPTAAAAIRSDGGRGWFHHGLGSEQPPQLQLI